jgi:hypothetical protein
MTRLLMVMSTLMTSLDLFFIEENERRKRDSMEGELNN